MPDKETTIIKLQVLDNEENKKDVKKEDKKIIKPMNPNETDSNK